MSNTPIKIKETMNIPLDYLENKLENVISLFETYKKNGWESIESITYADVNSHESSIMTLMRFRTETDKELKRRLKKERSKSDKLKDIFTDEPELSIDKYKY